LAARAGTGLAASLVGAGRRFNYELDYNDRSPSFHAADGFIPRIDIRSIDQTYSFRSRPGTGSLQAWGPDVVLNRTWDYNGQRLDYAVTPRLAWQWPAQTIMDLYYTTARQTLRPSEVRSIGETLEAHADRQGIDFQSAILPRLIGSASGFVGDGVNLTPTGAIVPSAGRLTDAMASATIRASRSLMIDISQLFDQLRDSRTTRVVYVSNISRIRVGEQFTRALAVRAIIQYNQLAVDPSSTTLRASRNLNYDVLLTFLRSPGSALYVGANYNLANAAASPTGASPAASVTTTLTNSGWQIFTKMSYLFRW
jgi:hypothetical protein